jgi:hypothetical protein
MRLTWLQKSADPYSVMAVRHGDGWVITIEGVGVTRASHESEVAAMVATAIRQVTGQDDARFDVEFVW